MISRLDISYAIAYRVTSPEPALRSAGDAHPSVAHQGPVEALMHLQHRVPNLGRTVQEVLERKTHPFYFVPE